MVKWFRNYRPGQKKKKKKESGQTVMAIPIYPLPNFVNHKDACGVLLLFFCNVNFISLKSVSLWKARMRANTNWRGWE